MAQGSVKDSYLVAFIEVLASQEVLPVLRTLFLQIETHQTIPKTNLMYQDPPKTKLTSAEIWLEDPYYVEWQIVVLRWSRWGNANRILYFCK